MKEIRLHGRGGQGVVKASQLVVNAAVGGHKYGQFIPFFGVERKGSPVFGYLRIDEKPIRRKMQVYEPDILVVMDDSLISMPATYEGLKPGGIVVINSVKSPAELKVPEQAGLVALVDASGISESLLGKNMPNTAVLGAFAKVTELVDRELLFKEVEKAFGANNRKAAEVAWEQVNVVKEA